MKRRHYLGILSTVSTGITAGCLGGSGSEEPACSNGNSWSPNVRADILTLSPGDSDEIDIHIEDHVETHEPGEILFEEGDWGNIIYLIKNGEIEIIRHDNGNEHLVSVIGAGEVLGEMTMFREESERTATARTRTDVECYKFLDRQVDQLLRNNENFRRKLLSLLTSRLHDTTVKWSLAESKQERLYVGALLGLKMFHLLSETDEPTIELPEGILGVTDELSIDTNLVEVMLNNPTLEELRSLPREQRNELTQLAANVLDEIQNELSFQSLSKEEEETEVVVGGDPGDMLDDLMRVKRVNTQLESHADSHYENLERENFRTYWQMYNELTRVLETVDPDHLPEPKLHDQLKSETTTLKQHLDRCDFETGERS